MSRVNELLVTIRKDIANGNGENLRQWFQVVPEAPASYHEMGQELRGKRNKPLHGSLERWIEHMIPDETDNAKEGQTTAWGGLYAFIKEYLIYWRDADWNDLLRTHELLTNLVNASATAFSYPSGGDILMQTCLALSQTLAQLTMTLSRRPDLLRKAKRAEDASGDGGGDDGQSSIIGRTSETIKKIFTTCLQDRTTDRWTAPKGRKQAVYTFANLVLKLSFACRKITPATMLLSQMASQAPLLNLYPAAQRVTFLYYLGRYWFANTHYLRAAHCLEAAYLQTLPTFVTHRARILTYLIPCNLLLGRFPSQNLLSRPETKNLAPVFFPLCAAIRSSDFVAFQAHLATQQDWLYERGLFLQLAHKLRPLLWRSLARKTFILTYQPPEDASSRKAATLDLADLQTAASFLQRRIEGYTPSSTTHCPSQGVNPLAVHAARNNANTTLVAPPSGPRKLRSHEGILWGNAQITAEDVELMVAEMVQQGLMHGFVAHGQGRFAIIGAKAKGPVAAGWPTPWAAIADRKYDQYYDQEDVPGWVKA